MVEHELVVLVTRVQFPLATPLGIFIFDENIYLNNLVT